MKNWAGALLLLMLSIYVVSTRFETQHPSLFYVAGVLGMAALVTHSGLGQVLGASLAGLVPLEPGADAQNFGALVAVAAALGTVSTMPGLPAIRSQPVDPGRAGIHLRAAARRQFVRRGVRHGSGKRVGIASGFRAT